jgi:hypothetical protein
MLAAIDVIDVAIVGLIFFVAFRPLFRRMGAVAPPQSAPPGRPFHLDLRFQFRLRTLMIVITLLAPLFAYIAWQARIVCERRAMVAEIESLGGGIFSGRRTTAGFSNRFPNWPGEAIAFLDSQNDRPSEAQGTTRWLLGDDAVLIIWLPATVAPAEEARIKQRIPEAYIWRFK